MRRNKKKKFENKLLLVGVNSAGLSSKMTSFDNLLSTLKPTIFFIEETQMSTGGRIKTENSRKYQIFELVRQTKTGGGIAIGALADVEPVLLNEGNDDVEVLVIEIFTSGLKIRCVLDMVHRKITALRGKTIIGLDYHLKLRMLLKMMLG